MKLIIRIEPERSSIQVEPATPLDKAWLEAHANRATGVLDAWWNVVEEQAGRCGNEKEFRELIIEPLRTALVAEFPGHPFDLEVLGLP